MKKIIVVGRFLVADTTNKNGSYSRIYDKEYVHFLKTSVNSREKNKK